ncbi:DNA cytosine methyltransferase [Streptomyces sp. NPDC093108]|uniref:DNA cytosine methyltransferase n=1 Tax=Streptomyces sp. NPDC093108 TaxID=3366030 RepID=UPI0038177FE4
MSRTRSSTESLPRLGLDDVLAATARPVPPVPGQSSLDDVPPEPLRIGSLFSGYGGLDLGVQAVLGGEVAWHCQYDPEDKFQYAARILAHHWPTVPNLGDITRVDWQRVLDELGPVDVLTGGFPCTDLSSAGQRLGLMIGTRSGLWHYMLKAIAILRPRLVVIENVRGILSTQARSGMDPCPCCLEHAGDKPLLRALGAVLGDLAAVGLDAEWQGVRASDVGAPHERFREFILAWPADLADAARTGLEGGRPESARRGPERGGSAVAADAAHLGHERGGAARHWRAGSPHGGLVAGHSVGSLVGHAAADATGDGRLEGRTESARQLGRSDAAERGRAVAADAESGRRNIGELPGRWDAVRQWVRNGAVGCGAVVADADGGRRDQDERDVRARQPDIEWGDVGPAIRRWETVLGRPHPWPTDDRGRLAPEFSEWMQGIAAGHVTAVPAPPRMSEAALRNARLKALGNGVVPLQSAFAVRLLLDRIQHEVPIQWLLARAPAWQIAA